LPPNWKIVFRSGGIFFDDEYGSKGERRFMVFENIKDGFKTAYDPRLSSNALKAKGVNVEEFIVI
jgi:coproporphyrinogen III oxidase